MGLFGKDEPRVIRPAGGRRGHEDDNRPTMHGSKSERTLMSGTGALIRWSGDHVQVTGEKPGRGR